MKKNYKQLFTFLGLLLISVALFAEEPTLTKEEAQAKKLDIKDLEKKYWTPKDTSYNVVQNRTYGKEKRFSLSLSGGMLLNDTFNDGFNLNAAVNYYFNENHGLEISYIHTDHKDSKAVNVFREELSSGTSPDANRMQNYVGVSYNFIPFYAKVSVLGFKIIYFDFAFSPGVGMVKYEQLSKDEQFNDQFNTVAINFDITQHFYFTKNFALRIDLRNIWYTEEIIEWGPSTRKVVEDRSNNTTIINLGLQYLF